MLDVVFDLCLWSLQYYFINFTCLFLLIEYFFPYILMSAGDSSNVEATATTDNDGVEFEKSNVFLMGPIGSSVCDFHTPLLCVWS